LKALARTSFRPEQEHDQGEDEIDITQRIRRQRPGGELVIEFSLCGESRIADDVAGKIEVHQGDNQEIAELDDHKDHAFLYFQDINHKAAQCIRNRQQAYEHDAVPKQRSLNGTIEVHHHRAEAPNRHKNHVELERPIEAIFLVLEKPEYDK